MLHIHVSLLLTHVSETKLRRPKRFLDPESKKENVRFPNIIFVIYDAVITFN